MKDANNHSVVPPPTGWSLTINGNDTTWTDFKIEGQPPCDMVVAALESVKFKLQLQKASAEAAYMQQMAQQGRRPDGKRVIFGTDGRPIG